MEYKVKIRLQEVRGNRVDDIEILSRETIESKIDDIDIVDLTKKVMNEALGYCSYAGTVIVRLDTTDGEISVYWQPAGNFSTGYFHTYITLMSVNTGYGNKFSEWNYEDLLNSNERDTYNELQEDKDMSPSEAYEEVLEIFNIDEDDRLSEYYNSVAEYWAERWWNENISEKLNDLYDNEVDIEEE